MKNKKIVYVGNTYFYKDELIAAVCVIAIALLGFIAMQVGKRMDIEVERQRQIELSEIAHDEMINKEVTR
jgi:hypothetical protein